MDCNRFYCLPLVLQPLPVTSWISRRPATSHLESHWSHTKQLRYLLLMLSNPTFLQDEFLFTSWCAPILCCSFSDFATCVQDSLLQPAAEQLCREETLPTRSLPWRYPMAEAQRIGDVSSRPPGLQGSYLDLQSTQEVSKMLPPKEALDGKGKVFWVASRCKMPSFWSPGGTNFFAKSTSSPEHLPDNCFSKFCVRKCTLFHTAGPLSH